MFSESEKALFNGLDEIDRKEAEAIKLDSGLYEVLTDEIIESYLPIIFSVNQLEGDFIAQFDRKLKESGITVNEEYVEKLWETKEQVPGVDLRTGEYGVDVAGAGFFNAGLQFLEKDDAESALENFTKALELCPRNFIARSIKAQTHADNGNSWFAVAEFGNAILVNPVTIAEKDSASREVLEKYPAGFAEICEEYLVHAYHYRAAMFHKLEKYDEAIADYSETLRRDPSMFPAMDERIKAYMATQRWDEAIADCDTLLAAGYEKVKIHQHKGVSLRMSNRFYEAILELTAAIELDPDLTWAYLQRSVCNWEENILEDAINDANEAIKRKVPNAHYYRAQAYQYAGYYTKAIEDFKAALREYPDNEDAEYDIKSVKREKKDGIIRSYERKNEKGEWESVRVINEKIDSIEPRPDYQQYLDNLPGEEMERWLKEKEAKQKAAGNEEG